MECEQLYRGAGYNTSGITPDGSKYLRPAPGGSSAIRTEVVPPVHRGRKSSYLKPALQGRIGIGDNADNEALRLATSSRQ